MRISNDELKTGFRDLMISSMVGLYGFGGEAVSYNRKLWMRR